MPNRIRSKVKQLIQLQGWIVPETNTQKIFFHKGSFLIWNGQKWEIYSKEEMQDLVIRTAYEHVDFLDDTKTHLIQDIVKNLAAYFRVQDFPVDKKILKPDRSDCYYLPFSNGILNLEIKNKTLGWKLLPFSPEIATTTSRDFAFNPKAGCSEFLKFLNEILGPKEVLFVQELLGLCLIPINPTQKFFVFYGTGANSKSTLLKVLLLIVGKNHVSHVPLREFLPNSKFGLILTEGKLLNLAEELDSCTKVASSELKNYVSQGRILVQAKFQDPYEIKATAKLIFATNFIPHFEDYSDGLYRRLEILPFNKQFLNPKDQKKELSDDNYWLRNGEASGILNWGLKGLRRLIENDWQFTSSEERAQMLANYRLEANPEATFLQDNFVEDRAGVILCNDLFQSWKKHAMNFNLPLGNAISFGRFVRRVFKNAVQSEGTRLSKSGIRSRYWTGLSFKNDSDANAQIAQLDSTITCQEVA